MSENKNISLKIFLITIGIIGTISGIFLAVNGNKIMGISGSIASAGIAIKGTSDIRKNNCSQQWL